MTGGKRRQRERADTPVVIQREARAVYSKQLLPRLAETFTREFGKGFDASNLRFMRLCYQACPICDALRHELSWTLPHAAAGR